MAIMNIFQDNNYVVVEEALSKEIAQFVTEYFMLKKKVTEMLFHNKVISPYSDLHGIFNDGMIENTFSCYADIAMETILRGLKKKMEDVTGCSLYENYSYARIYKHGDILKRHIDRFSCEISATLFLGGDAWPIYLDPKGGMGNEGLEVNLRPGDMLVYKGKILEHWRYPLTGTHTVQCFLHYNDASTEGSEENKYDKRPFVGLPKCFIQKK